MSPHKFLIVAAVIMGLLTLGALIENWRDRRRMTAEERKAAQTWLLALGAAFFVFLIMMAVAFARDLDGRYAQSPLKPWFDSLKSKGGGLCCSQSDGYVVDDPDWSVKDGHYTVKVYGEWVDVPEDTVIKEPNRAGHTMVRPMYLNGRVVVRCFLPGSMT